MLSSDPEAGTDVTIHRLCVQSRNELSISFAPGRHIDAFRKKAEAQGKSLPVSVNMGLDPAIYIGACFEAPTTPYGYNELAIAGGLRGEPVELVDCLTQPQKCIAAAEVVIEGEILPDRRVAEDQNTHTVDATVPYAQRAEFTRAQFRDVDPRPFAPDLFGTEAE